MEQHLETSYNCLLPFQFTYFPTVRRYTVQKVALNKPRINQHTHTHT